MKRMNCFFVNKFAIIEKGYEKTKKFKLQHNELLFQNLYIEFKIFLFDYVVIFIYVVIRY